MATLNQIIDRIERQAVDYGMNDYISGMDGDKWFIEFEYTTDNDCVVSVALIVRPRVTSFIGEMIGVAQLMHDPRVAQRSMKLISEAVMVSGAIGWDLSLMRDRAFKLASELEAHAELIVQQRSRPDDPPLTINVRYDVSDDALFGGLGEGMPISNFMIDRVISRDRNVEIVRAQLHEAYPSAEISLIPEVRNGNEITVDAGGDQKLADAITDEIRVIIEAIHQGGRWIVLLS